VDDLHGREVPAPVEGKDLALAVASELLVGEGRVPRAHAQDRTFALPRGPAPIPVEVAPLVAEEQRQLQTAPYHGIHRGLEELALDPRIPVPGVTEVRADTARGHRMAEHANAPRKDLHAGSRPSLLQRDPDVLIRVSRVMLTVTPVEGAGLPAIGQGPRIEELTERLSLVGV